MAHVETDNFFMGKIKNPKNNVCDVILQTCKVKTVSFTNQKSNLKDSNNAKKWKECKSCSKFHQIIRCFLANFILPKSCAYNFCTKKCY